MKALLILCTGLIATLAALSITSPVQADEVKPDRRCFELRTYYAAPGKLEALQARFRDHTMKIFERHGMTNIGYWVPVENPDNKLIYLLAYPDRTAREKAWQEFSADAEWQSAYQNSIINGKLVEKVESVFLTPTDYSPAVEPSRADEPRLFELRTYKAAPGKLPALHDRFRDHTIELFTKHGMTHFGYWTPMDEKAGANDTLIYILAHKNLEARNQSFADFRADPKWIAAKEASEKDGSLTLKVDAVLMKPTDYSPAR